MEQNWEPRIKPICVWSQFMTKQRTYNGQRIVSSTNFTSKKKNTNKKLEPLSYTTWNSQWIKQLNVSPETINSTRKHKQNIDIRSSKIFPLPKKT